MKSLIAIIFCLVLATASFSQGQDPARETYDQRFVKDSNRKSKNGKKKLSLKKKVDIQKKQNRAAKRTDMTPPKTKRRKPKH